MSIRCAYFGFVNEQFSHYTVQMSSWWTVCNV